MLCFYVKKWYLWQKVLYSTDSLSLSTTTLYLYNFLCDSSLESEWRFLLRSLRFRSSFFAHYLSLTGFHSLVNFSNSFRLAPLASSRTSSETFFISFVFFFHSNRSVQNTKLQTHFLITYQTKPNTALESKAAFVHLNCIVHSASVRNSRERKFPFPHSYC
jgi:hypothetical protein